MRFQFDDSPEFRGLVEGDPRADLTRIALEIAADAYPGLLPDRYLDALDALADRVRHRCPARARPGRVLDQINWVLFVEERFRGNTEEYYDPRNSYLNEVIDRRVGIPISLSTLYLAVADRLGLEMDGVNLPAHFLLRVGQGAETIFIDPFHAGALLDREGCRRRVAEVTGQDVVLADEQLAPCPMATIVARMLRNLKAVYLRDHQFTLAIPVLRRLVALDRDEPLERRDLGACCLHADRPGEAIDHLGAYLDARPDADDAEVVTGLLRTAWKLVASGN